MRCGSPAHKGLIVDNVVEMEELIFLLLSVMVCYSGGKTMQVVVMFSIVYLCTL